MRIAVVGYGMMGQLIKAKIDSESDMECMCIINSENTKNLFDNKLDLDVIVDFSHPDNLKMIGSYVEHNPTSLVIATTGYSEEQIMYIKELSMKVPIVYTSNFSLGITVVQQILKQITPILQDTFNIELIEKHHNQKLDAPSGTAKMLLNAIDEQMVYERVHGRMGNQKRSKEIGIHAIRGGTIVGEHTVMFAGQDEIIEITHKAHSKQIFVNGALRAARFVVEQQPGLYDMNNVLFG